MTFYIAQSVVFVAVFAPYASALGAEMSVAGSTVVVVAAWLLSVVIADLMRRAGWRGPFETLLRRLTYRSGKKRGYNS